jgi:hypothetical protein
MRFEVKEVIPPRIHNPPGWMGKKGGCLITHCVWDNKNNEEYTVFATLHAAQSHCEYYNHSKGEDNDHK